MNKIFETGPGMTKADKREHALIRLGYKRGEHRVEPGLYSIGKPSNASPVFVTSNYKLSFDAVRTNLHGVDGYILVLDTKGINVWCAAGKGTFGTEELVTRIETTGLKDVVSHRQIILPQLGAPGVAAHEVKKRTGFSVIYGPVRACDIKSFISAGMKADPSMRKVDFPLMDRLVLIPVELKNYLLYALIFSLIGFLAGGAIGLTVVLAIYIGGLVLFPALFPYLPTKDYSTKGMFIGALVSVPLIAVTAFIWKDMSIFDMVAFDSSIVLFAMAFTGYLGLNWTGCTPYPSRTGVRKEIFRYIPIMAVMAIAATVLTLLAAFIGLGG